jgi:ethanolamine utilization protein EutJ
MVVQNNINRANQLLEIVENIVNDDAKQEYHGNFQVGVDLGTADIVLMVLDTTGKPIAAFLEWANVVRDGVVVDYWGAIEIVKRHIKRAEDKLDIEIRKAITSYPPGTDPKISVNVLEAAGLAVENIVDEPSSVLNFLQLENGAVVDIGGGTTGVAIVENSKIIHSADEPTGGIHITYTLAGNRKISIDEAEEIKREQIGTELVHVTKPVFEKMASIVQKICKSYHPPKIYLSGGTFCMDGIKETFEAFFPNIEIILPYHPLYLTPLAIASYTKG